MSVERPRWPFRFLFFVPGHKADLIRKSPRFTRRISSGGGNIVASQSRAGAEGEGLPLDGELREYLKATFCNGPRKVNPFLRRSIRRVLLLYGVGARPPPDGV